MVTNTKLMRLVTQKKATLYYEQIRPKLNFALDYDSFETVVLRLAKNLSTQTMVIEQIIAYAVHDWIENAEEEE